MAELYEIISSELLDKVRNTTDIINNPIKDINLFSILGMENKEVSAHSAFLYYILKPFYNTENESNGFLDDLNLRLFYKVLKTELEKEGVQLDDNKDSCNLDYINIEREVVTSNGRLDFLISYSYNDCCNAIVIELKIWAGEQTNQIERYNKYIEKNGYRNGKVIFLTPQERSAETGEAINITLKKHIIKVLNEIIETRKEYDSYTTIIKQYIAIINKLTNEGGYKEMSESIIIKSVKDLKAIDALYNARTELLTNLLIGFVGDLTDKFKEKLDKDGLNEDVDYEFKDNACKRDYLEKYYVRGYSCKPEIVFKLNKYQFNDIINEKIKEKNIEQDYYPCFYIVIEGNLWVTLTAKKGDLEYVEIDDAKQSIIECGSNNASKWYVDWSYIRINNERLNFKDYNNIAEGVLRIFEEDKDNSRIKVNESIMNQIVDAIFSEFKTFIEKFLKIKENKQNE